MRATRRIVQGGFLAMTLAGVFVFRANCERWCPFGGVEALPTYLAQGDLVCSLGASNFFILGGVLAMTLLLRRAFCAYVCPIGTLSDWLDGLGRWLGVGSLRVPPAVDRALASLKYVVLGLVVWLTWQVGELVFRGFDPCYAMISRHGADITPWAYVVSGLIALGSLVVVMPFCRWFCPLAATLNPLSRFGLARVRRQPAACRDCGRCARSCPMAIPVDQLPQVTVARCISCLSCVDACPERTSGALSWGPPAGLGMRWSQAALIAILLGCTSGAVAASYLFPLPSFVRTPTEHQAPDQVATVRLKVTGLYCRGSANRLLFFLTRDDLYAIRGFLKIEAWPGPDPAGIRITYDPAQTDELAIQRAITEPYCNLSDDARESAWMLSPFQIEGYDPLGSDPDAETRPTQTGGS